MSRAYPVQQAKGALIAAVIHIRDDCWQAKDGLAVRVASPACARTIRLNQGINSHGTENVDYNSRHSCARQLGGFDSKPQVHVRYRT
jgi:hypothetical protein